MQVWEWHGIDTDCPELNYLRILNCLVLAAELGKALLEKNEELSKENEKIAEEFSHKLEVRGWV